MWTDCTVYVKLTTPHSLQDAAYGWEHVIRFCRGSKKKREGGGPARVCFEWEAHSAAIQFVCLKFASHGHHMWPAQQCSANQTRGLASHQCELALKPKATFKVYFNTFTAISLCNFFGVLVRCDQSGHPETELLSPQNTKVPLRPPNAWYCSTVIQSSHSHLHILEMCVVLAVP